MDRLELQQSIENGVELFRPPNFIPAAQVELLLAREIRVMSFWVILIGLLELVVLLSSNVWVNKALFKPLKLHKHRNFDLFYDSVTLILAITARISH